MVRRRLKFCTLLIAVALCLALPAMAAESPPDLSAPERVSAPARAAVGYSRWRRAELTASLEGSLDKSTWFTLARTAPLPLPIEAPSERIPAPEKMRRPFLTALWLAVPLLIFGAVTVTQDWRTPDAVEYKVTATADGDTVTPSTAHGMGARARATILGILQAPAGLALWAITTLDGTNFVATKGTAAGSGNAGDQIRIRIERNR